MGGYLRYLEGNGIENAQEASALNSDDCDSLEDMGRKC